MQWNLDTNLPISDDEMLLMEAEEEMLTWSRAQITNLDFLDRDTGVNHLECGCNWNQGDVAADDELFGYGGYSIASGSTIRQSPMDRSGNPSDSASYHREYSPLLAEDEQTEVTLDLTLYSSMIDERN